MRLQGIQPDVAKHSQLISNFIPGEDLFTALDASAIGIVICDRRFRYKALNGSAAKMHNVPVEAHLGHTVDEILGHMADKVLPNWENVFTSGQRLSNLEITGRLPQRPGVGRWIESLFPLADSRGRVAQVGCLVIELTPPSVPGSPPATPAAATRATLRQPASDYRPRPTLLTPREQEIVRLVAEGKSNKEIAAVLAISVRTVETYRSRLMLKLQAPSIAHLVQYAIKNRIITL